jgi:lipopolysaccharide export system protein LptA
LKYLLAVLLGLAAFCIQPIQASAQSPDTTRTIEILNADTMMGKKIDTTTELLILVRNVKIRDGKTLFTADSVVHNKKTRILEAFGNVHINDADSIHTRSQYLIYYIDKKQAVLKRGVSLTDGKGILTTQELFYDTQLKTGTYSNGGKVVNGKTVLTSKEATYYGDIKDVYFKKNVKLKDPAYDLTTDSLLYNTDTQIATFITKTLIVDSSKSRIVTSDGYYDLKNKKARFGKRARIQDKGLTITGEDIVIDDATGEYQAIGNAVLIDTIQGISVLANDIQANKKSNTFIATQHPLLILKQQKDSIYVTADTLFSGLLTDVPELKKQDTLASAVVINDKDSANRNRYFKGFHNVRIFSDSLQAISDSLFYSGRDSIFRLFKDPIVWAAKNQVTGDTIYLYTKNRKPERLYVFENGMVINDSGDKLYNQIKGNTLNGYFKDGSIDYMRAKGSAESVYYAQDETNAYVGMNSANADIIDMYFLEKALNRVVFRNSVTGTFGPIKQMPEEKKLLRNFKWLDDKRPKTRFELFGG